MPSHPCVPPSGKRAQARFKREACGRERAVLLGPVRTPPPSRRFVRLSRR